MCSKVNSTDTTVNNVNRTCPTTVLNTSTTLTRVTDDSSSYTQGDFELDTSVNSELGESTPIAFAPPDPTQQDLEWPQLLDECRLWLISAVRETNTCAQSTPSLPPSTTEKIPIARLCMDKQQTGSHTSSPANRDVIPHHDYVDSNRSPPPHVRAGDSHDTSGHHCPGDEEMPPTSDQTPTDKVLPTSTRGHSDRQSPPTAELAHQGNPPDEDPPKRVAESERYDKHIIRQIPTPVRSITTISHASQYDYCHSNKDKHIHHCGPSTSSLHQWLGETQEGILYTTGPPTLTPGRSRTSPPAH